MEPVNINLRDYLGPNGKYPYDSLTVDMERYLSEGRIVRVWSVAGHFMASGHPTMVKYGTPWSDARDRYYRTAKDCIDLKNEVE